MNFSLKLHQIKVALYGAMIGFIIPVILIYVDLKEVALDINLVNILWVINGQKVLLILTLSFPTFFAIIFSLILNLRKGKKMADEATQYVEQIFNSMLDSLLILDHESRIIKYNENTKKLLEDPIQQFGFLKDLNIYENNIKLESIDDVRLSTYKFPLEVTQPDTGNAFLLSRSEFIRDEKSYYVISLRNINNLKELQAELINTQKSMAESARLAGLGQMAAGIAHEINNPLAIITLKAQLLERKLNNADLKTEEKESWLQEFKSIGKTVERVSKIVHGLRNLGRSSDNELITATDLSNVFSEIVPLVKNRLNNTGINLDINMNADVTKVLVRPLQLSQVIINLINNSIDAITGMDAGWITILGFATTNSIMIRVVDSGMGINHDVVEKMFNPFFTTKDINEGTGLGLSLAKSMMTAMEGDVRYELYQGHTSFVIEMLRGQDSPVFSI